MCKHSFVAEHFKHSARRPDGSELPDPSPGLSDDPLRPPEPPAHVTLNLDVGGGGGGTKYDSEKAQLWADLRDVWGTPPPPRRAPLASRAEVGTSPPSGKAEPLEPNPKRRRLPAAVPFSSL
ncbi:hypothetical protein HJG60_009619 [Phyllostomus discolor]|uniref:Uncharacterized protein n=1 Tax=Phyllostomus discolor TaxID=89673 RepID=A0A833YFY1_9CHIR|nr:hypothetical protein HJG60_009619 [Phyllostomus discolor]